MPITGATMDVLLCGHVHFVHSKSCSNHKNAHQSVNKIHMPGMLCYSNIHTGKLHKSTPVATLFSYKDSLCFCSLPSSCLSIRYRDTHIWHCRSIHCFHLAFPWMLLLQQQHTLLQLLQNCWDPRHHCFWCLVVALLNCSVSQRK